MMHWLVPWLIVAVVIIAFTMYFCFYSISP